MPGKLERGVIEAQARILALDFSGDSQTLAVLCENGELVRWDVLRGETIGRTSLRGEAWRAFDLGTRRRFAVAVTNIAELPILEESSSGELDPGPDTGSGVELAAIDENRLRAEDPGSEGESAAGPRPTRAGDETEESVRAPVAEDARFRPSIRDRTRIEVREWLEIWDSERGVQTSIPLSVGTASFVLFDSRAERIAAPGAEGLMTVWHARDGSILKRLKLEPRDESSRLVAGASFGVIYYLGSGELRIRSLDAEGMDTVLSFPRDPSVDVAVAGDSRTLASVNREGAVEIRRLPDGDLQTKIDGSRAAPRSLALSRDGSVLALHRGGTTIELWDTRKAELLDRHESTLWMPGTISFSPDGNIVAWVEEDRRKVRFWSPAEGAVVWKPRGPELIESARAVCPDLASSIRFRLVQTPFAEARAHLERGELPEARRKFGIARKIFPTYPGLAAAAADAEERHEARVAAGALESRLAALEARGKYVQALGALDEFLRDFGRHDGGGFAARATKLRSMLEHFQLAEAQRQSRREIDAVVQFEMAVSIVPELARFHPDYAELREGLVTRLMGDAALSFETHDHKKVLELYDGLKRLRPLDSAELFRYGESGLNLDQPERAREAFQSISESAPEYAAARRRLARIARENGELELARAELERSRAASPNQVPTETDYAEVCELLGELDLAVAAWERIGELESGSARPFERIGSIEERRKRWKEAGQNYRAAIRRSSRPRPKLLMKVAEAYGHTGDGELVLEAYVDLLEVVRGGVEVSWLGDGPARRIRKWIADLGYVHHRGEWILKDQFLAEQGWMRRLGTWMRPEEVRLREVISRTKRLGNTDFRTLDEERYPELAAESTIVKGMNRREVLGAWGFFVDQNVVELDDGDTIYEQLLFEKGRMVYLRNGIVCFWTE